MVHNKLKIVLVGIFYLLSIFSRSFVYVCVFKYVYVFVVEYLQNAYCNSTANEDSDSDSVNGYSDVIYVHIQRPVDWREISVKQSVGKCKQNNF